jgi:CubicO group peptidase (beta-lactamase class C family)
VPGAVVAIARDGRLVHYKAYGFLNKANSEPMPLDAIFQLASMTKIMTSVAALTLNEDGRLPLKSRHLPAFNDMKAGKLSSDGEITTEPAKPIYIHDLFRHTSGIVYGGRGNTPIHKLYPGGSAVAAAHHTGEEFLAKLSSLPLL